MRPLGVATLAQLKYVVFDIETTGLSPTKNRIIQIAAVKINGGRVPRPLKTRIKNLNPSRVLRKDPDIFNAFINPGSNIPAKITELTGITNTLVRKAPKESTILKEFFEFVGDRILVAHNGIRFDVKFIETASLRNNLKYENFLCMDTLWLSRRLFPQERRHTLATLVERHNIGSAYSEAFLNQMHNALVDVMLTAEALRVFISELKHLGKDKLLLI